MNELISAMASDMGIEPYYYESNDSYYYRILFSALGQWCLKSASSIEGISKHAQTFLLNLFLFAASMRKLVICLLMRITIIEYHIMIEGFR